MTAVQPARLEQESKRARERARARARTANRDRLARRRRVVAGGVHNLGTLGYRSRICGHFQCSFAEASYMYSVATPALGVMGRFENLFLIVDDFSNIITDADAPLE